jgi:hypothetical protein
VNVDDFACDIVVNVTTSCFAENGSFQVDGYAAYHCGHTTC